MGNNLEKWFNDNIFGTRKLDGIFYLFLYILVPIVITSISLSVQSKQKSVDIYCYVTILVSAFNSLYDAYNRWSNKKSIKNIKLFIMMVPIVVIVGYCTYIILSYSMIGDDTIYNLNWLFLVYIITIVISLSDIIVLFTSEMAFICGTE